MHDIANPVGYRMVVPCIRRRCFIVVVKIKPALYDFGGFREVAYVAADLGSICQVADKPERLKLYVPCIYFVSHRPINFIFVLVRLKSGPYINYVIKCLICVEKVRVIIS